MGTSRELISYWETGQRNPCGMSKKFLSIIAEKEGVSLVGEGK
jgi:DNA-binding transcriptional regulator YiaG